MGFFNRLANIGRGIFASRSSDPAFSAELDAMLNEELSRTPAPQATTDYRSQASTQTSRKRKLQSLEQRYRTGNLSVDEYTERRAEVVVGDETDPDADLDPTPVKRTL